MAKRFLDTNYYKSSFVRGLEGALKTLYSYIICDCDGAGIWHLDLEIACVYIGFNVTQDTFKKNFIDTGKAIPVGNNKFFFPDFIQHQYPHGLIQGNRAHKNFIDTLKKLDLIDENLQLKTKGLQRGLEGSSKEQGRGPSIGLGNVLEDSNSLSTVESNTEITKVISTDVGKKEKKTVELKTVSLDEAADLAKKNGTHKRTRKPKVRNPDSEPYWHVLRRVWVDFNLKHLKFKVEPIPEADYSAMHRIIEKIRERATDQGVPWTEQEAVTRWEKFLTTAYNCDKFLKENFDMKIIQGKMQVVFNLVDNGKQKPKEQLSAAPLTRIKYND